MATSPTQWTHSGIGLVLVHLLLVQNTNGLHPAHQHTHVINHTHYKKPHPLHGTTPTDETTHPPVSVEKHTVELGEGHAHRVSHFSRLPRVVRDERLLCKQRVSRLLLVLKL